MSSKAVRYEQANPRSRRSTARVVCDELRTSSRKGTTPQLPNIRSIPMRFSSILYDPAVYGSR